MDMATPPRLSSIIPRVFIGGSNWSNQLIQDPHSLPINEVLSRALQQGIRGFDTSPYYGESEIFMGRALSEPSLREKYPRNAYILMTKVGRISANKFDYSPSWIRQSVERSLSRFSTDYIDVVFCHDIEFVTLQEVIDAVGELLRLKMEGRVKYVGISGYPLDVLLRYAVKIKETFRRPLDAVQTYCHYNLQNSALLSAGYLSKFREEAGVDCVFNASPLSMGLLRKGGVPIGELGDFHPAPLKLREATKKASDWVESKGDNLASLALRYAVGKYAMEGGTGTAAIFAGAETMEQLEMNLDTFRKVLEQGDKGEFTTVKSAALEADEKLYNGVKEILGEWYDYSWKSPDEGWSRK